MTIQEEMKEFLEKYEGARERSNKTRAIRAILVKHFPELNEIPKDTLIKVLRMNDSYDRAWRKVLQENKHLRGTDYSEKDELEILKQQELGYNV